MGDSTDKVAIFQAITGLNDSDLCTEILAAHGWDVELAVSAFTDSNFVDSSNPNNISSSQRNEQQQFNSDSWQGVERSDLMSRRDSDSEPLLPATAVGGGAGGGAPPGIAWKLITLPISIISGSLGLISGAIGIGIWVAGGVFSHSINLLGWGSSRNNVTGDSLSPAASEALNFVTNFDRDYGNVRPNFVSEGFMDALQRSRQQFKLLFVYLHSPDHPDTQLFCERSLCSEVLSAFINENFVSWGGSIRASEGFKMSNSLKASRFPFCAVVMAATNQRIALLQQIEGPKSPEEMLSILQRVVEESSTVLVTARVDAEERRNNIRLREEQDAAYRAALEADHCEIQSAFLNLDKDRQPIRQ